MHLLDQLKRPIIIAHRGASIEAPENTLASFKAAVRTGAKAIEIDTMLSADEIPVVIHDHRLERTTNGFGEVSDHSYRELMQLDTGSWFSKEFKEERLPGLRQVLEHFSGSVLINIELKNYHSPNDHLAEKVIQLVDDYRLWDSILFSSFLPRNIQLINKFQPDAKTALLCPKGKKGMLFRSFLYRKVSPEYIHPAFEDINRRFIQREHQKNRRVNVWTINDAGLAKKMISMGVDGIITDDPKTMLEISG